MDHLSLAALAFLPEVEHTHLGSLVWSLGKLGTKLGAARIHTPVLHAVVATAWRRLHDLTPDALCNTLYGFGLLNFHPGDKRSRRLAFLLYGPQLRAAAAARSQRALSLIHI